MASFDVHKTAERLGWPQQPHVLHSIRAANSASLFLEMGQVASARDAILQSSRRGRAVDGTRAAKVPQGSKLRVFESVLTA